MPEVELEFFGAARTVTGSMHLLHIGDETVSMDCGLFQGRRSDAAEKNRKFPIRSNEIDAVLADPNFPEHGPALAAELHQANIRHVYEQLVGQRECETARGAGA